MGALQVKMERVGGGGWLERVWSGGLEGAGVERDGGELGTVEDSMVMLHSRAHVVRLPAQRGVVTFPA